MQPPRPQHRKKCKRYNEPWQAHAFTFSCFGRKPFLSRDRCRTWFLESLDAAREHTPFDLWAYVIMPDHIHLVLLPHINVTTSDILCSIKEPMAKRAIAWVRKNAPQFLPRMARHHTEGKVSHHFWLRGGGYDRNLRSISDVHEKISYVHANPVRRGLVSRPEDWPWSSARQWVDGGNEPIRIDRDSLPPLDHI